MKTDILIFYNHYYPAYKAGGPVQSLVNLAALLKKSGQKIAIITSSRDLNESETLKGITPNEWNEYNGYKVYYLSDSQQRFSVIRELIETESPGYIYVNGLYSIPFVVFPLWIRKKSSRTSKVTWAPRGMLQSGALAVKPFKKRLFLTVLRLAGLHKNVTWHATDEQEMQDIKRHFGKNAEVIIAPNIPKKPFPEVTPIGKMKGALRLVYLSLISEKKNLDIALQVLKDLNCSIVFDIYGPVKDPAFWETCKAIMADMPEGTSVNYMGDLKPEDVQQTLTGYHALLLPSKGENFGHVIYESFSVGRPVIISTETPWKNLEEKRAGFDISLQQPDSLKSAIQKLYAMEHEEYKNWCHHALKIATDYWQKNDFQSAYSLLFDNLINRRIAEQ